MMKAGNKKPKKLLVKSNFIPSLIERPKRITNTEIRTNASATKRRIGIKEGPLGKISLSSFLSAL